MTVNLSWIPDVELSVAHLAAALATSGRVVDAKLEQSAGQCVAEINERLIAISVDVGEYWSSYFCSVLNEEAPQLAVRGALVDAGINEFQLDQTAAAMVRRMTEIRDGLLSRYPKLVEQLPLRARPLKDQWDTYGAGLLRETERQVWGESAPDDWWPARMTLKLVQPVRGGDGGGDEGGVWIEAVLTDVDPRLPEVLRLAWLVSRAAIEIHSRGRSGDLSLLDGWSLASIPLTLQAGANLGLINQPLPVAACTQLWRIGGVATADRIERWWKTFQSGSQPLPIAVRELSR